MNYRSAELSSYETGENSFSNFSFGPTLAWIELLISTLTKIGIYHSGRTVFIIKDDFSRSIGHLLEVVRRKNTTLCISVQIFLLLLSKFGVESRR